MNWDEIEYEFLIALHRIYAIVDARAAAAQRVIASMAQRDRRGIGQLTRFDRVMAKVGASSDYTKEASGPQRKPTTGTAD